MATPKTGAPEWEGPQASPWLPANKARRIFDAFCYRTAVIDRDLTAPPGSCADGALYLVDTPATGAWAGHDGEIAIAFGENASNGWVFAVAENEGAQIWVEDEDTQIEYLGGSWVVSPERIVRIDDLADVDLTGLNDGDSLYWDASNGQWYGAPPGGASAIDQLTDIGDVDPSNILFDGAILQWDLSGEQWAPVGLPAPGGGGGGATALSGLSDVDFSGDIPDGYVLKYDLSQGKWFPSADEGGSGGGAASLTLASTVTQSGTPVSTSVGFLGCPQMADQDDYTLALTDSGGHYYHVSGTPHTLTIPANASVAFPRDTVIAIVNENGAGAITLAITTDTLRWGSSTGSRTIAANGTATLLKVTATVWRLTGDGIT